MATSTDPGKRSLLRDFLLLGWIAATGLFFFLRFSATFYAANEGAFARMRQALWP